MSLLNSLVILFVFCIGLLISFGQHNYAIFAQISSNNNGESTVIYGCEDVGTFHCDRLHNKIESYEIQGNSSTLYHAVDRPIFVSGKENLSLAMYANYLKSIVFSNTSNILPKQFTIAFWIKSIPLINEAQSPSTIGNILSRSNDGNTGGWSFKSMNLDNISKGLVKFSIYNSKGDEFSIPDIPISNNSYTHIVATFNGSSIVIYKNGTFFGEKKFKGNFNNDINIPLTLGVD